MDIVRLRHARKWAHRFTVALVGAGLAVSVVPPLALAPASAAAPTASAPTAVLGLFLAPVEPVISGAGSITSTVSGLACSNPTGTTSVTCPGSSGLSLTELGALTQVVLTAVPATGWDLAGWTGCSSTSGPDCTVTSALGTPLAPTATFLPEADPTLPGACGSPAPIPGADCTPPVTAITQKPTVVTGNRTREKTATFGFKAFEADGSGNATTTETTGATFECQLKEPNKPAPTTYEACTTPKTYSALVDGTYTLSVRALDGASEPNRDATPESFTWTVDATAPETTVTSGPGTWVLNKSATLGLGSSEQGSTFRCYLDGAGRYCTTTAATVAFAAGTHTFTAFAKDAVGNEDTTAASRTFTMPVDDRGLKASTGWKAGKGSGYFLNTFVSTTKKGATLKASGSEIKRIALVVTKGKGFGVVKVYLGQKLLKKVSLAATTTRKKQVVNIASFSSATRGTVKVVVASANKKVMVEGLGIASK